MKTRLSFLLLCSTLFASFAGAKEKADYSWTVIDSDKEFLAGFLYLDVESDKVVVEKNNREFKILFERLTKNCRERVLFLHNQQISQRQIKRLEEKISRLDKLAGEAIRKLDARLQKIEANNANPVAQRQQAKPRAVFMGPNGQEFDNPNDAFNANQRQNQIDDLQRQMDIIEFNQMSGGPPLLIP
jgi:hypothetical protein